MSTYRIIRKYQSPSWEREIIATGLTLEEAREHCNDEETSSSTCTEPGLVALTRQRGPWFDCYTEE